MQQSSLFNSPAFLPEAARRVRRHWLARTGLAWLIMMQVMMLAFPGYLKGQPRSADAQHTLEQAIVLMNWASLVLCVPLILYCAWPFWQGAWRDLSRWRVGMDVPVALGILAAFVPSALATWQVQGEVYFDSASMFVAFLLTARYLQILATGTDSTPLLDDALKTAATNQADYATHELQAEVGPYDEGGFVLPDHAALDVTAADDSYNAMHSSTGNAVPSGACAYAMPDPRADITGKTHDLPQLQSAATSVLLPGVDGSDAHLLRMADRLAFWFVWGQLSLAAIVGLYWWQADPQMALPVTVALLVISCPCAMSMAVPMALAARRNAWLRHQARLDRVWLDRACIRVSRQNLYGSLAWHLFMTPLAAIGLIQPWVAAISMLLSSLAVAANAWRLSSHARLHPGPQLAAAGV